MEWDAGAFMRIAIGIFFLALGAGASYALIRLAGVFGQLKGSMDDISREVVPLLTRFQTTVDEVNSELGKVDDITGSVVGIVDMLENTTVAVHSAIGSPIKKLAALSAGIDEGLSTFFSGRRKET